MATRKRSSLRVRFATAERPGTREQHELQARLRDQGVDLEDDVYVAPGSIVLAPTSIGLGTRINGPIRIGGAEPVRIGRYCAIGFEVLIVSDQHAMNRANVQWALNKELGFAPLVDPRGSVTIGHNVWVGDRAVFLAGVTVGDGAVIGAASVVTKDVPPFHVAAGVPARPVRPRFAQDVIDRLGEIAWWDWPKDRMARNRAFFEADLGSLGAAELDGLLVD